MPLPTDNVDWPPPSETVALRAYRRYGAWYSGDPEQLTDVYADTPGTAGPGMAGTELPTGQPSAPRFLATIQRGIQRMFWGQPPSVGQIRGHKVHIPLAGDIAATSADLLFGEPPEIRIPADTDGGKTPRSDPVQARLDEILEQTNAAAAFSEAAELGSAFGGAYLRIRWDPVLADCPLLDVLPPDVAVPEWRGNRLVAVTFWRHLERLNGKHWRHLERHEPGRILHGLYMSGDEHKLGRPMALTDHPETAQFAMLVDAADGQSVETGATGLTAEYLPNMRPNRVLRGSPLGRSDYAGVEPLFDALDEAWTSWMRDLRLGKGRLVVPRTYIQSAGRGRGAQFDADREVYEAVDALDNPSGGMSIQIVQFEIRVEQHAQTCQELANLAVRGAGYSTQTFGETGDVAMTATESTARQAASYRTRAKKINYGRGPLARIALTLLEVDAAKFGTRLNLRKGMLPVIEWPDGVAVDPNQQAQTLQLLGAAEAASIRTRVKMLNPEWEDQQIDEEVTRIKEDTAPPMPVLPPPGSGAAGSPGPTRPGGGAANKPQSGSDASSPVPPGAGGANGNARPAP